MFLINFLKKFNKKHSDEDVLIKNTNLNANTQFPSITINNQTMLISDQKNNINFNANIIQSQHNPFDDKNMLQQNQNINLSNQNANSTQHNQNQLQLQNNKKLKNLFDKNNNKNNDNSKEKEKIVKSGSTTNIKQSIQLIKQINHHTSNQQSNSKQHNLLAGRSKNYLIQGQNNQQEKVPLIHGRKNSKLAQNINNKDFMVGSSGVKQIENNNILLVNGITLPPADKVQQLQQRNSQERILQTKKKRSNSFILQQQQQQKQIIKNRRNTNVIKQKEQQEINQIHNEIKKNKVQKTHNIIEIYTQENEEKNNKKKALKNSLLLSASLKPNKYKYPQNYLPLNKEKFEKSIKNVQKLEKDKNLLRHEILKRINTNVNVKVNDYLLNNKKNKRNQLQKRQFTQDHTQSTSKLFEDNDISSYIDSLTIQRKRNSLNNQKRLGSATLKDQKSQKKKKDWMHQHSVDNRYQLNISDISEIQGNTQQFNSNILQNEQQLSEQEKLIRKEKLLKELEEKRNIFNMIQEEDNDSLQINKNNIYCNNQQNFSSLNNISLSQQEDTISYNLNNICIKKNTNVDQELARVDALADRNINAFNDYLKIKQTLMQLGIKEKVRNLSQNKYVQVIAN